MATYKNLDITSDNPIEVEFGTDDDDSSSCAGTASTSDSYTTSLSSSVFDFVYENGRRYTSQRSANISEYLIPNDEEEQSRLDLAHHLWGLLLNGKLHQVALPSEEDMKGRAAAGEPFRVLDLGTGTGIWAIDFGDMYPSAEVLGVDISPIQPDWIPPNVKFEVDNFEDEWVYKQKFDFIHGRNLVGSIKDYPTLFKNIYKNLKPGGIVEFQEHHISGAYSEDDTLSGASPILQYNEILTSSGAALGQRMDTAPEFGVFVKDAGFSDVAEYRIKCPVGVWPKNKDQKAIGAVCQEIMQTGVEAYGLAAMTRILGWEAKKARVFCEEAVREFNNRRVHTIYPVFVVHGMRPE